MVIAAFKLGLCSMRRVSTNPVYKLSILKACSVRSIPCINIRRHSSRVCLITHYRGALIITVLIRFYE